ncbi:hypothetical protein RSOL_114840, partial [Rhizoctonia solani AG-3 Rhs1AP]
MSSFAPPPLHSTPTQVRVQSASNTLKTSELHLLQNELRDNIVPNVEFDFFVKEVLKFSGHKYGTLVQSVRKEQLGSADDWSQHFAPIITSGGEPYIYDPLIKLVHWIQDQLREKLSWESATDLKFRNTWSKPLGGSEADRKPDITAVSGPQTPIPSGKTRYCLHSPASEDEEHKSELALRVRDAKQLTTQNRRSIPGPSKFPPINKNIVLPAIISLLKEWRLRAWQSVPTRHLHDPAELLLSNELLKHLAIRDGKSWIRGERSSTVVTSLYDDASTILDVLLSTRTMLYSLYIAIYYWQ